MDTVEQIAFVRSQCLPGIDFLRRFNSTSLYSAIHEHYIFSINLRGTREYRWRGRLILENADQISIGLTEPGDLLVMTRVIDPVDRFYMFVPPKLFLRTAEEHNFRGPVHLSTEPKAKDSPEFRAMVQLLAAVRTGASALEQQSRLAICLRIMLAHADHGFTPPRATNASAAVRKAMAYLREHYRESVGLDELAGLTGMNGFYLAHAFREYSGMPPHAFLTRVRIERARSLLICGMPPGKVATEVGFADQSHLHRHFKQALHLTPGEYVAGLPRDKVFA